MITHKAEGMCTATARLLHPLVTPNGVNDAL